MRQLMSEQDFADIRHLLPDSVLGLMQVAGEEHTFTLIRRFGGTNIPVGKNYQKSGKALHAMLAEEVGEEAALRSARMASKSSSSRASGAGSFDRSMMFMRLLRSVAGRCRIRVSRCRCAAR